MVTPRLAAVLTVALLLTASAAPALAQDAVAPGTPPQKSFLDEGPDATTPAAEEPGLARVLLRLVLALVLIFALLVGGLVIFQRVARRGLKLPGVGDRPLNVMDRVSLGPKQGVVLLSASGRRLLLGVTEKEIAVLLELDAEGKTGDFAADMRAAGGPKAGTDR
jgi:flagellar biogenesis protein FliO